MIVQSLRLGARRIVRYPGISAVTFLTLAIGIAVSATIFAVSWSTLVRPFAFADQDRLVQLWATQGDIAKLELSYDEFLLIRAEAKSIESMAAISAANFPVVLKRRGEPMQLNGNLLGNDFFRTLGIKPHLGRTFTAAESRVGGSNAALLSYRTWQNRFGGDRNVIREVLGNSDGSGPVPIVGVLPKDLELPAGADIVFPVEAALPDADARADHVLSAIAKLRPGATLDELRRELTVITAHEQNLHPETHPRITQHAYGLVDELLGSTQSALRIILVMGLLVLLIALFNAASVALAQGIGRTAELGVRRAVGSTRLSNLFHFFLEASVLSLAAGAAGFLAARALLAALLRIAPPSTPRIAEVHIGWETAAFAFGTAVAAALVAAAAQAFRATDRELMTALRASAKSTSHRGSRRLLEALAAAQTAVAIVTLVVAALLTQSFRKYASIDVGFSTDRILTVQVPRGYSMAPEPEKARQFFRTLFARLRSTAGVEAVGSVLMRPLEIEQGWDFRFTVEGQTIGAQEQNPLANLLSVTPGYFEAMKIGVLAGRNVRDDDRQDGLPVAVVSESFARRFFGDARRALGHRVKSGKPDSAKPWMTIVGVVRDIRSRGLTIEKLDLYIPYTQTTLSPNYVAIRTAQEPEAILPAVRAIVAELDKDVPVSEVRTAAHLVDAKLAQPRLSASIVVLFAITATFLALIGFYGMLSYTVRERTPEIGVRMAIGAAAPDVLGMIVRRAAVIAAAGIAAGLLVSFATDRLWRSYLYGVTGIDGKLFAAVAIAFELVAIAASVIPAARAARVDAMTALRSE